MNNQKALCRSFRIPGNNDTTITTVIPKSSVDFVLMDKSDNETSLHFYDLLLKVFEIRFVRATKLP